MYLFNLSLLKVKKLYVQYYSSYHSVSYDLMYVPGINSCVVNQFLELNKIIQIFLNRSTYLASWPNGQHVVMQFVCVSCVPLIVTILSKLNFCIGYINSGYYIPCSCLMSVCHTTINFVNTKNIVMICLVC